jgi:hypothetical protein
MLTMEAELRALREELTSRPAAKAAKAAKASSTSSSNLNSSTEEQKEEKLSSTNETPTKAPNGIKPTDENAPPSNKRVRMSSSEDNGSKKVSVDKIVDKSVVEQKTEQDVSSKENKNDSSTNQ